MRDLAPAYPCNEHFKLTITSAAVGVLSFLDANGGPIRCERMYLRYEQSGGAPSDHVNWKSNPNASLGTDPDADHFWLYPDETGLMVPEQAQDIRFFTANAGTYSVYVLAHGYEDLSNSTIA